jgi:hypothetical protein
VPILTFDALPGKWKEQTWDLPASRSTVGTRPIRALLAAGVWSVPVFVVAFSVGQLLRIPGLIFR